MRGTVAFGGDDAAAINGEAELAVLEVERLVSEHFTPPALHRGDVGAVIGRDGFEIIDGRNHLGGDRVLFRRHAQQYFQ